jgi:hypothetical protein
MPGKSSVPGKHDEPEEEKGQRQGVRVLSKAVRRPLQWSYLKIEFLLRRK